MGNAVPVVEHRNSYPGSKATVREIIDLADSYYHAARVLLDDNSKKMVPYSSAPARMAAIHAIELYINAFLRHEGSAPEDVRKRMHHLAEPNLVRKLKLRKRTAEHLDAMTTRREYLIARYAPERVTDHTQLNRLYATLDEVMKKVGQHVGLAMRPAASVRSGISLVPGSARSVERNRGKTVNA
ncbi:MAG: hypothetical protein O9256_00140 [Rhizobiaceae bacterium]|nr:hypothetical protein [Rhizobiaceae bacterium]MCZ8351189.1 hypothetical protein [Rhizobium sp.]